MSFSMKVKDTGNYDGPQIDWKAVAEQVEDDSHDARISLIVDLGVQKRPDGVSHKNKDDFTIADTEEEANDLLDLAEELLGDYLFSKEKLDEFEETEDGKFKVKFKIYPRKDAQEVAIFADLVDTRVEYVKGEEEKQYRVMLNKSFKSEITGLALTKSKPIKEGGMWTFATNSMLHKLAIATGHKEIVTEEKFNTDIGRILGEPFALPTTNTNDFIKVGTPALLSKKQLSIGITELDNPPVGLTFENATVDLLEAAQLRFGIIQKIKNATNYEGSAIQAALEELEAKRAAEKEAAEEEQEEAPAKKTRKSKDVDVEKEESPKRRGRKKKEAEPEPETEDSDDFDDDVPF